MGEPSRSVPFIGSADLAVPFWAEGQDEIARAGPWKVAAAAPRTVAALVGWSWRASPRLTALAGVLQVASAAVTAFGLLATTDVFAQLFAAGPTPERVLDALPSVLVVGGALVGRGALQAAVGAVHAELEPRVEQRAQDELYSGLIEVEPVAFEDAEFTGLVERATQIALMQIRLGAAQVGGLISAVMTVVAAVVTAGLLQPVLAPVVLLAAVPQAWALLRGAQLQIASLIRMNAMIMRRDVTGRLIARRQNVAEVRAFTAQHMLLAEHRRINADLATDAVRVGRTQNLLRTVGSALGGLGVATAFVVLGLLLYAGWLPLPVAGAAFFTMQAATTSIRAGVLSTSQLFHAASHVEIYRACLEAIRARHRPPATAALGGGPTTITLDGVSFRYPGQARDAVHDVGLTLRAGEVVALVGENGSGKTTLAKLITGLYRPTTGSVRWDGVDIADAAAEEVHERVGVVMQEPIRWPATAENNVRVGRLARADPDGAAFADATRRSGADRVLAELPQRESTLLSRTFQGGHDLSGGQWQRVSVARGLYRDAAVVIADEPTSAMDARAEREVFTALRELSASASGADRITVLVTHRLANIRAADQIIVLDQGRVVEHGTHRDLLARGGLYNELYTIQADAYTSSEAR
ncbi:ABC transporter ATP-binding protein [Pseudonocardia sp. RS010]|uniref:ABC transporter ATP-binding protein n=1 Tax=Pseudonocardia sp. RS010 TaxID=3385979 RepID=UPI00399F7369